MLRWRCAWHHALTRKILSIFLRAVFRLHLLRTAESGACSGRTGSVTAIQRFGGALNINVHFHSLVPDGVWTEDPDSRLVFRSLRPPTRAEVSALALTATAFSLPIPSGAPASSPGHPVPRVGLHHPELVPITRGPNSCGAASTSTVSSAPADAARGNSPSSRASTSLRSSARSLSTSVCPPSPSPQPPRADLRRTTNSIGGRELRRFRAGTTHRSVCCTPGPSI